MLIRIWLLMVCFYTGASVAGELINKSIDSTKLEFLLIDIPRGAVDIQGWDQQHVLIKGELDDAASRLMIKDHGRKLQIKVAMQARSHAGQGSQLHIFIPHKTVLWFNGIETSFSFKQLNARIEGRTISGDLTLDDVAANFELSTVSGSIDIKNSSGNARLESINGDIFIDGEYDNIAIKSMSGNINAVINKIVNLKTKNISGQTTISGDLSDDAVIKLSSFSGALHYQVIGELDAQCQLSSQFGGKIENTLTNDLPQTKHLQQQVLKFVAGDGSATLTMKSVSGSMKIGRKKTKLNQ